MSTEEWRPVPGLDGYEASNLGRIRSWRCRRWSWPESRLSSPRLMNPTVEPRGWASVCTAYGVWRVHRLVLLAFVGPMPEGMETRHLDNNKTNNRPENLVYGTHSQNILDQVAAGTHNQARKTHCLRGHEFDEANTYLYRGSRICRECHRIRSAARKRRARLRAA